MVRYPEDWRVVDTDGRAVEFYPPGTEPHSPYVSDPEFEYDGDVGVEIIENPEGLLPEQFFPTGISDLFQQRVIAGVPTVVIGEACNADFGCASYLLPVPQAGYFITIKTQDFHEEKFDGLYFAIAESLVLKESRPARGFPVADPSSRSHITFDGYARDVVVDGPHAYVAVYDIGLTILDVSDPGRPAVLGTYPMRDGPWGVRLIGQYAYVDTSDRAIEIVDVSDPRHPTKAGSFSGDKSGWVGQMPLPVDHYGYLSETPSRIAIVDLAEPSRPRRIGHYEHSDAIRPRATLGKKLFATMGRNSGGESGFVILDLADPLQPRVCGEYLTKTGRATDLAVAPEAVFLALAYGGLEVVDVSSPCSPRLVMSLPADRLHETRGVVAQGPRLLVIEGLSDVFSPSNVPSESEKASARREAIIEYDLANTTMPVQERILQTFSEPVAAAMTERYAYVALGHNGLEILDLIEPGAEP